MEVYKLIRVGERRALKAYFSGEPLDQVCRRFGYSRVRIKAMAEDYKSGIIDIFSPMDKKRIGEIIFLYNNVKLHLSVGNLTPVQARGLKGEPAKLWKNYFVPRQGLPA